MWNMKVHWLSRCLIISLPNNKIAAESNYIEKLQRCWLIIINKDVLKQII